MANDGLQIESNAMKAQNKATISDVHEGKKGPWWDPGSLRN